MADVEKSKVEKDEEKSKEKESKDKDKSGKYGPEVFFRPTLNFCTLFPDSKKDKDKEKLKSRDPRVRLRKSRSRSREKKKRSRSRSRSPNYRRDRGRRFDRRSPDRGFRGRISPDRSRFGRNDRDPRRRRNWSPNNLSPAAPPPPPNIHLNPMAQNFMQQPMMYTDGYNTFQNGQFVPAPQYATFDYNQQPGFMPGYAPPPPVLNQPIPPGDDFPPAPTWGLHPPPQMPMEPMVPIETEEERTKREGLSWRCFPT
jgi:hypothetical protein